MESQQGLLRKAPVAAVSTPVSGQAASSSGPKTNWTPLKVTAAEAATPSVTDNEVPRLSFTYTLILRSVVIQSKKKHELDGKINLKILVFFAALVGNAPPPDCAGGTAAAQEAP